MNSTRQAKPIWSCILQAVLLVGIIGLLLLLAIPNFVGSRTSKLNGIINALRQLDSAKEQWALERGITNSAASKIVPTIEEIVPYLGGPTRDRTGPLGFDRQGHQYMHYGESYVINALSESPEAVLTKQMEEWPKGARIRLNNGRAEIMLPDGSTVTR